MTVATSESAVAATPVQDAPCLVYRWCTETGQHDDHTSEFVTLPSAKADEPDYLDAHLLHFAGSRPIIGVGSADLDAEQARMEAAKLRAFAEQLETLATILDATCITVDGAR